MPSISVIVPVYKVENFLHRCVDSILAQTFEDFEVRTSTSSNVFHSAQLGHLPFHFALSYPQFEQT